MDTFIKRFTTNWHAARWLRSIFSIVLFYTYFTNGDNFALIGGFIFGYQAIFNVGCCGAAGCATNNSTGERKIEVEKIKRSKYTD